MKINTKSLHGNKQFIYFTIDTTANGFTSAPLKFYDGIYFYVSSQIITELNIAYYQGSEAFVLVCLDDSLKTLNREEFLQVMTIFFDRNSEIMLIKEKYKKQVYNTSTIMSEDEITLLINKLKDEILAIL